MVEETFLSGLKVRVSNSWTGKFLYIRGKGDRSLCGFHVRDETVCVEFSDAEICPKCKRLLLGMFRAVLEIKDVVDLACVGGLKDVFEKFERSSSDRQV